MDPPQRSASPSPSQRALIFDPLEQSVTIKKTAKVASNPNGDYWSFELPRRAQPDCWDLFMNPDETQISAIPPAQFSQEGFFLGRLNLQKLGLRHRLYRKYGTLATVYIAKPGHQVAIK